MKPTESLGVNEHFELESKKEGTYNSSLNPYTKEEIIERALKSENDIKEEKVLSQEELERLSDNW